MSINATQPIPHYLSMVLTVAACLLLGAVPGSARATAPPPLLVGVRHIATMGASITQFAARPGGYVWLMQHFLDALYPDLHVQVVDVGVSGNTSSDMVARFLKDVIDRGVELVTIKEGYNDLSRRFKDHPQGDGPGGAAAEVYGKNMNTMVQMAQKAGIRVLIMTPTIYEDSPDSIRNEKLKEYVAAIRDVARQRQVPLADQNAALLKSWHELGPGSSKRLTTDGVHLTLLGDAVLARTTLLALGIRSEDLTAAEPEVQRELQEALRPGH